MQSNFPRLSEIRPKSPSSSDPIDESNLTYQVIDALLFQNILFTVCHDETL